MLYVISLRALTCSLCAAITASTPPTATCCRACCFQVPLYALNQHVCFVNLEALDMGGSITIHVFGAHYGLAASLMLSNGRQVS